MLGFPLGILSAAGAAVGFQSDYELISTTVLGGTATSVTFSSLATYASTYKHLQIRMTARTTRTGTLGDVYLITLNGDTGSNYAMHELRANGSVVTSSASTSQTSMLFQRIASADHPANAFGASVIDFLDSYSTTKNKTVRAFAGVALGEIFLNSGFRNSTESITSITISRTAFNFVAGSRFSLYGIKG
jgi:hypothetical protein